MFFICASITQTSQHIPGLLMSWGHSVSELGFEPMPPRSLLDTGTTQPLSLKSKIPYVQGNGSTLYFELLMLNLNLLKPKIHYVCWGLGGRGSGSLYFHLFILSLNMVVSPNPNSLIPPNRGVKRGRRSLTK